MVKISRIKVYCQTIGIKIYGQNIGNYGQNIGNLDLWSKYLDLRFIVKISGIHSLSAIKSFNPFMPSVE